MKENNNTKCDHDRLLMPSVDYKGQYYCRGCERHFHLYEAENVKVEPKETLEEIKNMPHSKNQKLMTVEETLGWEEEWEKLVKDEFMLSESTPDPKGSQRVWSNAWNLQQRTKVFIRNLLSEQKSTIKKELEEWADENWSYTMAGESEEEANKNRMIYLDRLKSKIKNL